MGRSDLSRKTKTGYLSYDPSLLKLSFKERAYLYELLDDRESSDDEEDEIHDKLFGKLLSSDERYMTDKEWKRRHSR